MHFSLSKKKVLTLMIFLINENREISTRYIFEIKIKFDDSPQASSEDIQ